MAVIQISKVQVRRGLQENLPQLDGGEMGWSTDERRLYIGNGTLSEGAPEIGVTEILTEYSVENLGANVTALESNVSTIQTQLGVPYQTLTLSDNQSSDTETVVEVSSGGTSLINYNIVRGSTSRVGTIKVTQLSGTAIFEDDYTETADTGVTLNFTANGSLSKLSYTTSSTGTNATLKYFIKSFE